MYLLYIEYMLLWFEVFVSRALNRQVFIMNWAQLKLIFHHSFYKTICILWLSQPFDIHFWLFYPEKSGTILQYTSRDVSTSTLCICAPNDNILHKYNNCVYSWMCKLALGYDIGRYEFICIKMARKLI